jgi:hypothetical protein
VTAGAVLLQDTNGTIAFLGDLAASSLTADANAFSVSMLGGTTTVTGASAFSNTGTTTFGNGGDTLTFTGGVTATAGAVQAAGMIVTVDTGLTLGAVTISGGVTLRSGSGTVSVQSITDGGNGRTLALGNGSQTGAVTVTGATTVGTLTTFGSGYAVSLLGGGTIDTQTTFLNTGTVTLGNDAADSLTFTAGVTATAPSSVLIAGTVAATTGASTITLGDSNTGVSVTANATVGGAATGLIDLGDVTLADGVTLTVGTGIGNAVNLDAVAGTAAGTSSNLTLNTLGVVTVAEAVGTDIGTVTITNSGGVTFQDAVSAATVAITDTADGSTVSFQGNLAVGTAMTVAANGSYNVSITGALNSVAGATTFGNTGTLTLGDGSGDVTTFAVGLTATAPGSVSVAGTVQTTHATLSLGAVTLTQNGTFLSGSGAATLASVTDGTNNFTLTLGGTGPAGAVCGDGVKRAGPRARAWSASCGCGRA